MTIICAAIDSGGVWLGSDTMYFVGGRKREGQTKWCRYGDWWIGTAGDSRFDTSLAARAAQIQAAASIDAVCAIFRNAAEEDKFNRSTDVGAPDFGQSALVVVESTIWDVDGSFHAMPCVDFGAVGSGAQLAYGAYSALRHSSAAAIVHAAVRAAIDFGAQCGGGVNVQFSAARPISVVREA